MSARTAWSWGDSGVLSGMQRGSAGQGRAESEGREQQRLSRTCCAPGAGGTQGRSGERCCPVARLGRGLMRLWDRCATLLSASEESRCAPPLLRAALRTLSEPTELKSSGVVVASARLAVPTRVAQGSVRVTSPGLSPAGCRALAPPAEAQEAVPAATGASCRNFPCRRGLTVAWACANLSVGDNCHGKWTVASVATTLPSAVPFILPSPSC